MSHRTSGRVGLIRRWRNWNLVVQAMVETMGLEPRTPCLQTGIGRSQYQRLFATPLVRTYISCALVHASAAAVIRYQHKLQGQDDRVAEFLDEVGRMRCHRPPQTSYEGADRPPYVQNGRANHAVRPDHR